jgi:hypothetical protein
MQPLVDSVANRLPTWKSCLMLRVGHTTLTKVELSTILVHVSIMVEVSPWIIKMVDKFQRAFIWIDSDTVHGGQCLVAWQRVVVTESPPK